MRSLLTQLDDESILLMYLADELPAADRAEVEGRLSRDQSFRESLETIRVAHAKVSEAMNAVDGCSAGSGSTGSMERTLGGMIRQWQTDRLRGRGQVARAAGSNLWRVYMSAVAAIVLVGLVVWWGLSPDSEMDRFGTGGIAIVSATELDEVLAEAMYIESLADAERELDAGSFLWEVIE